MDAITVEKYIEHINATSHRARTLAKSSPFSAEDWQSGIDLIGEHWTMHAEIFARRTNVGFLRTIREYRKKMDKGRLSCQ